MLAIKLDSSASILGQLNCHSSQKVEGLITWVKDQNLFSKRSIGTGSNFPTHDTM